mmetsp:Transcript_29222/g.70434  ORF Transcript_29222/g.70434 Transcript_29222/m.70434 type:complete len:407 (-) Transcript_29222:303-1523(-)
MAKAAAEVANPRLGMPPRNETLTATLPAEFGLNWEHYGREYENLVPNEDRSTLMGVMTDDKTVSGFKDEWECPAAQVTMCVIDKFRGLGYAIKRVPDAWKIEDGDSVCNPFDKSSNLLGKRKTPGDPSEEKDLKPAARVETSGHSEPGAQSVQRDHEIAYLKSLLNCGSSGTFQVFQVAMAKPVALFEVEIAGFPWDKKPWLIIRCERKEIRHQLIDALEDDFNTALLLDDREDVEILHLKTENSGLFKLEAVTGCQHYEPDRVLIWPTTKFSLYYNTPAAKRENSNEHPQDMKLVCKAQVSYSCEATLSIGPTIEMFETAKEWRQHGIGTAVMRSIHDFMCDKFYSILVPMEEESYETAIPFSVKYLCNPYALQWFRKRHHFRMEYSYEDLSKFLQIDEYESFEH